ncbi:hypothetical protein R1flu_023271 [Riccia fluitans]|uniref:ATP synthase mitochondrial F1 complex assembly factor 1 n=1 Tax=Riccia fluitans TaxID=41844 RepID=A0ABD1XS35_9MARC
MHSSAVVWIRKGERGKIAKRAKKLYAEESERGFAVAGNESMGMRHLKSFASDRSSVSDSLLKESCWLIGFYMMRSQVIPRLLPLRASAVKRNPVGSPSVDLGATRAISSAALHEKAKAEGSDRAPWGLFFTRGSKFATGYSAMTRKPLDSIMKVESVKFRDAEEITQIWNDYHIGRGHISAVMGSQLYAGFEQRAKACPFFVIPIKQGMGYMTLFVQAQMPYMLFTSLGDYQARGPDATPYLTVSHYDDLAKTKGIVLVRGDVVLTSKLSDAQARTALEAAHSFYLRDNRYRMVQNFNQRAEEFEFRDVLRELGLLS